MGWRNWSYWLRGGIVSVIILIIFSIITSFKVCNASLCTWIYLGISLISALISFPLLIVLLNIFGEMTPYISTPLSFFLFGALIGFIIGKIKSRKQINH